MNIIESKENNKLKELIKIRDDAKYRREKSLFFVEGERIISDSPKDFIKNIFIQKSKLDSFKILLNRYDSQIINIVDDSIFNKIQSTVNSQGIIAILHFFIKYDLPDLSNINRILILDKIQDPGNLGTILRVAEATNINLLILTNDSCDIYNPKVIRSCMSSIFRTNIYIDNNIDNTINKLKLNKFDVFASVLDDDSIRYNDIKYDGKVAIIIGNEGNGIRTELINLSNKKIMIPMCGEIESLNVAMATGIICYEMMRQNNFYES